MIQDTLFDKQRVNKLQVESDMEDSRVYAQEMLNLLNKNQGESSYNVSIIQDETACSIFKIGYVSEKEDKEDKEDKECSNYFQSNTSYSLNENEKNKNCTSIIKNYMDNNNDISFQDIEDIIQNPEIIKQIVDEQVGLEDDFNSIKEVSEEEEYFNKDSFDLYCPRDLYNTEHIYSRIGQNFEDDNPIADLYQSTPLQDQQEMSEKKTLDFEIRENGENTTSNSISNNKETTDLSLNYNSSYDYIPKYLRQGNSTFQSKILPNQEFFNSYNPMMMHQVQPNYNYFNMYNQMNMNISMNMMQNYNELNNSMNYPKQNNLIYNTNSKSTSNFKFNNNEIKDKINPRKTSHNQNNLKKESLFLNLNQTNKFNLFEKIDDSKSSIEKTDNEEKIEKEKTKRKKKQKNKVIDLPTIQKSNNLPGLLKTKEYNKSLQETIENVDEVADNVFFEKIKGNFIELSEHQYANYIIQKLIPKYNKSNLICFFKSIKTRISSLIISNHGTKIVQILFAHLDIGEKVQLSSIVMEKPLQLMKDCNGFHVVLCMVNEILRIIENQTNSIEIKYLQILEAYFNEIKNLIKKNFYEISVDKYGCCFIQKFISKLTKKDSLEFINLVKYFSKTFINHVYANYIIQFLITLKDKENNDYFLEILKLNLQSNCKDKSTSNVIEKLLLNHENCESLIEMIFSNTEAVKNLVNDCYGNYGKKKIFYYFF